MDFDLTHIEALSEPERRQRIEVLLSDEVLLREYALWRAVMLEARDRNAHVFDDRELLVLYALRDSPAGALTPNERSRVEKAAPAIEAASASSQSVRDVIDRIVQDASLFDREWRDAQAARRVEDQPPVSRHRRPSRGMRYVWRVAALVAVIAFAGTLWFVAQRGGSWVEIDVASGIIKNLSFADGSSVRLVGPASLSYGTMDEGVQRPRRSRLKGSAYFDIVSVGDPFTVETSTARISVVGTSFGVRSSISATEVILAGGRLAVAPARQSWDGILLEAGQALSIGPGPEVPVPVSVDLSRALAWADMFVFRGTPVSEIVLSLSEFYGVPVSVDAPLAARAVSGTFDRSREIEDVLSILAATLGARLDSDGSGYRLSPLSP